MPKTRKDVRNIYLTPEINRKLKKAAEKSGMTVSVYLEQVLKTHFRERLP